MSVSPLELRSERAPGRVPPHNLDAEASLLGAMLLSRDAIASAVEVVKADDFYKPAHGHVYEAIVSLYGAGEPADPVTVAEELRRAGVLDAIGGTATLVSLQTATPATSNAGRYARIVEEHALLRRLIGVAGDIAEMGYEMPEDVTAVIDYTLAASVITKDPTFIDQVTAFPHIDRLNIGPVSTMKISWDQPHEGNMFEFLWQRRSIERAW